MSGEREYQTPRWQTLWLGIAFLALVAIAIATVLLPELEDDPERGVSSEDPDQMEVSDKD